MRLSLYDLMFESGRHEVFGYSSAEEAYDKSTAIKINFDSERVGIISAHRTGDVITIDIDIDG